MNDELQRRTANLLKEKGKYGVAVAVMAAMLFAVGFPGYVLVFLGVTGFFIWKAFAPAKANTVRSIFEFYLTANEILRDDDRRWFGFELQEAIHSGEKMLHWMPDPPPLLVFTLGALHHKAGNFEIAGKYLSDMVENSQSQEDRLLIASPELKNYVRVLRRIEREPAEAPQTAAAVRALERARRNRGTVLLEDSRKKLQALKDSEQIQEQPVLDLTTSIVDSAWNEPQNGNGHQTPVHVMLQDERPETTDSQEAAVQGNGRQSISEVLKDIYGR